MKDPLPPILEDEVKNAKNSLKDEKTPGPDGISGELIKSLKFSSTPIITELLNGIMKKRETLERWEEVGGKRNRNKNQWKATE